MIKDASDLKSLLTEVDAKAFFVTSVSGASSPAETGGLPTFIIPTTDELLEDQHVAYYAYEKKFAEAALDPIIVSHIQKQMPVTDL